MPERHDTARDGIRAGAFVGCTAVGLAAGAILWCARPARRHQPVSLAADSNQRPRGMSRHDWREVIRARRADWRTPRLETLPRPSLSVSRTIGLLTLRCYIIIAIVIMAIKLVQVTTRQP
ncbi:MAG: hypothetical protein ACRDNS_13505 [Trebonia sp.]